MTKWVKAEVAGLGRTVNVKVRVKETDEAVITSTTSETGIFEVSEADFKELGPDGLKALRAPRKAKTAVPETPAPAPAVGGKL